MVTVKEYKYEDETFQLDDSKGCYVTVNYRHLTGHVGVNIAANATPQHPYAWLTGSGYVTPDGVRPGTSITLKPGVSLAAFFNAHIDGLCDQLLKNFRTEEAAKAFDAKKYCAELHGAVKNLP